MSNYVYFRKFLVCIWQVKATKMAEAKSLRELELVETQQFQEYHQPQSVGCAVHLPAVLCSNKDDLRISWASNPVLDQLQHAEHLVR
eukprot:m.340797 g.340797  ORF g.340797 m.340797 type:complete len:87 (-) comp19535_c0_seq1:728-988(-)